MFGNAHAGLRHDIPYCLSKFEERTKSHLGCAIDILKHRTLFGPGVTFFTATEQNEIASNFLSTRNSEGRSRLGLKKAGTAALKFCPICVRDQQTRHGFAWWRIEHQLLSSFFCDEHHVFLKEYPLVCRRGIALDFHLPSEGHHTVSPRPGKLTTQVAFRLSKLGRFGKALWQRDDLQVTEQNLRWCYRLQARNRGWTSFDGSIRLQSLRDEFVAYYDGALELIDRTAPLGNLAGINCGFLGYLFRECAGHRSSIKHFLLISFLFDDLEAFDSVLRRVQLTFDESGALGCEALLQENQRMLFRLVETGQSLTKAAAAVGTSVSSAAAFLDKHGDIQPRRRPHIVGTERESVMANLLDQGLSRMEIARAAGVRRGFIKDYLAQRPEQKRRWEKAHREQQIEIHRSRFLAALRDNQGLSIKSIRRLSNNGFQWLYNNDREWLESVLPAIWKR